MMPKKYTIRTYKQKDKNSVVELVRLNTPVYFAKEEEKDFEKYLENHLEDYFVVELNHQIIAAGGVNYAENKTVGKLSWGVVHPDFQNKGIGSLLTTHRINTLKALDSIQTITVRTSQLVAPFYEKQGFVLKESVKDYWGKGLDLHFMKYERN